MLTFLSYLCICGWKAMKNSNESLPVKLVIALTMLSSLSLSGWNSRIAAAPGAKFSSSCNPQLVIPATWTKRQKRAKESVSHIQLSFSVFILRVESKNLIICNPFSLVGEAKSWLHLLCDGRCLCKKTLKSSWNQGCVYIQSLCYVQLCNPMGCRCPPGAPLSMRLSCQEYWEWVLISSSRDLSDSGIESHLLSVCIDKWIFTTEQQNNWGQGAKSQQEELGDHNQKEW